LGIDLALVRERKGGGEMNTPIGVRLVVGCLERAEVFRFSNTAEAFDRGGAHFRIAAFCVLLKGRPIAGNAEHGESLHRGAAYFEISAALERIADIGRGIQTP